MLPLGGVPLERAVLEDAQLLIIENITRIVDVAGVDPMVDKTRIPLEKHAINDCSQLYCRGSSPDSG